MEYLAVRAAVGSAQDLIQWLTVGILDYCVIEFPAHNEIDRLTVLERWFRQRGHVRPHEGDLQLGIGRLHGRRQLNVALEGRSAGEQDQEFVILPNFDGFCRGYLVRRSEEHTSELQSLRHLVCRLLLEKKKKTNALLVGSTCVAGGWCDMPLPRSK